ncbi:hypothetical protein ACIQ1H_08660 [Lysinibacillus sp. NPDC097279]|uniref:hypothetical protein n=1 Tax=Lysinibacillus sp. NPDC097279 TaxID=3364143 RepID=UPI0037F982D0
MNKLKIATFIGEEDTYAFPYYTIKSYSFINPLTVYMAKVQYLFNNKGEMKR